MTAANTEIPRLPDAVAPNDDQRSSLALTPCSAAWVLTEVSRDNYSLRAGHAGELVASITFGPAAPEFRRATAEAMADAALLGTPRGPRDLLRRWERWATAHGHDVGMLDDTREMLGHAREPDRSQLNLFIR